MFNKKIKLAKFSYLHMVNISHEKLLFEPVRDLFPKFHCHCKVHGRSFRHI